MADCEAGSSSVGGSSSSSSSAFGALKKGFKSVKKLAVEAVASEGPAEGQDLEVADASSGASAVAAKMEGNGLFAAMEKARKAVADKARELQYDVVPQAEGSSADGDAERGTAQSGWNWAKRAAARAQQHMAEATQEAQKGLATAAEKAKSAEWGEQALKGLGNISNHAASAGAALQEKGNAAKQKAKDLKGQGAAKLQEANALAAKKAAEAKEKASAAAGSAKDRLAKAGESISGLKDMAMSPAKLAQFAGVFLVGLMLIMLSFNFLPMLVVAPQKFALLFAFGSMILLSSFAVLKGPKVFMGSLLQREKLPFSAAYLVGLIGTLVATIIMKSFVLTAVFGLIQFIALLYFLASFVPGGQMALNGLGRCCRAVSTKLMGMMRK